MTPYPSLRRLTLFLACAALVACAPIRKGSPDLDAHARRFSPQPGRAALYVARPNQFVASGAAIPVFLDHDRLGSLPPKAFLYVEILPREHVIELAELSGANSASVRFQAVEGRCHFYKATAVMGGLRLEQLEVSEGQALVSRQTLSGDNRYQSEVTPLVGPR